MRVETEALRLESAITEKRWLCQLWLQNNDVQKYENYNCAKMEPKRVVPVAI